LEGNLSDSQYSIDDVAERAKKMLQFGNYSRAEQIVQQAIQHADLNSSHTEALYSLAVSQRYQKKYADALATLEQLQRLEPGYSRSY
jgi:TolA-binding protein